MDETLLVIHILSAAAWIGGSMFLGFAGPRMGAAGGPAAGAWLGVALAAATRFFLPAALLTAASGITMVAVMDEWAWSDAFVWMGLAVFAVVLIIALGNNMPAMKSTRAAAQAGNMEAAAVSGRKLVRGGAGIVLLLVVAEIAMVLRFGAG